MSEEETQTEPVDAEVTSAPTPEPVAADVALSRREALQMQLSEGGFAIRTFEDALSFGKAMINSGFAPKGFNRASQVVWAIQTGREVGLAPAAALRAFYIPPGGRPSFYAEAAHAIVMGSGLLEDERMDVTGSGEDIAATYHYKRKGRPWASEPFSYRDAIVAGLVKKDSNWLKYPRRMVKARAKAFGLHDGFPDLLLGLPIQGQNDDSVPAGDGEPSIPATESPDFAPPQPPQKDPLLEKLGIPQGNKAAASEAPRAEPIVVDCDHPESTWREQGKDVVCTACGSVMGPAV